MSLRMRLVLLAAAVSRSLSLNAPEPRSTGATAGAPATDERLGWWYGGVIKAVLLAMGRDEVREKWTKPR